MNNRIKIIYIICHPPAYEMYKNQPRPKINWDTPSGSWVGVWDYDWGSLLGKAVSKKTSMFDFEVWQPDTRADKIYCHLSESNVLNKLLPIVSTKDASTSILQSTNICQEIDKIIPNQQVILHLGVRLDFEFILKKYAGNKSIKILGTFHGNIKSYFHNFFMIRKRPINYIKILKNNIKFKNNLKYYDFITYQNNHNLQYFKSIYSGPISRVTMGVDFDKFKPIDRIWCRKQLNLPLEKKIFLTVSRLNPSKQIDKVISIFKKLNKKFDFLLIVAGSPSKIGYLDLLIRKADPLIKSNKIIFTGYKSSKELVNYYNASDLFIMPSKSEAGPVVSMEAMACNLPILSSNTGRVAEFLKDEGKGCLVEKEKIDRMQVHIEEFLKGKNQIASINREVAMKHFDWNNVSIEFIGIYSRLFI